MTAKRLRLALLAGLLLVAGCGGGPTPVPAPAASATAGAPATATLAPPAALATAPPVAQATATQAPPSTALAGSGGQQPVAIFHAFNEPFSQTKQEACALAAEGYSHLQIPPAQKSNPAPDWWARYQPVDYSVIEGRGSEQDLRDLVAAAHRCQIKVIADVVFNHMANMPQYQDLHFPGLSPADFHPPCAINYDDGNRDTEVNCWLSGLPDLDQTKDEVRRVQQAHLQKLLDLGIDGFRFDAAKHMPAALIRDDYISYINTASQGRDWNYLEVITDHDTHPQDYTSVATITDFVLYHTMKIAFSFGGDLRTLRVPQAVADPRSVTFGRDHDQVPDWTSTPLDPYADPTDSYLATAYVLARQAGTPLVLNRDDHAAPFIPTGVQFRHILAQRAAAGADVSEQVVAVVDSPTLLVMERGAEGFFVVNKAAARFDVPVLDLTLTKLEGCYRELRNSFFVAIERRADGKKYVTRWGTRARGGMEVQGRDALYFIRDPWEHCAS